MNADKDDAPSRRWSGIVRVDPEGEKLERRFDRVFRTRSLWVVEDDWDLGRLDVHVYPANQMVQLIEVATDARFGHEDSRRRGGARALMDTLEQLYPAAVGWWFAADPYERHSFAGKNYLMHSRCRPGRQWIHSTRCTMPQPLDCPCNPPWVGRAEDSDRPSQ